MYICTRHLEPVSKSLVSLLINVILNTCQCNMMSEISILCSSGVFQITHINNWDWITQTHQGYCWTLEPWNLKTPNPPPKKNFLKMSLRCKINIFTFTQESKYEISSTLGNLSNVIRADGGTHCVPWQKRETVITNGCMEFDMSCGENMQLMKRVIELWIVMCGVISNY